MSDPAEQMTDEQALEHRTLRQHQLAAILDHFKKLRKQGVGARAACVIIAPIYNRSPETIYYHIQRFRSTSGAAADYLRSNALKMAMRVVRKANVDQAIDVLSRPNIGVLEPAKGKESGGGGGFFISVNADSCGAVKVGVATREGGEAPLTSIREGAGYGYGLQGQIEGATGTDEAEIIDVWEEGTAGAAVRQEVAAVQRADETTPGRLQVTGRGTGHSKNFKSAVEAARKRVAAARERAEERKIKAKARELKRELKTKV